MLLVRKVRRALDRLFPPPGAPMHIIGYPKTGNTWLRFLLGRYFQILSGSDELLLLEGTRSEARKLNTLGLPRCEVSHGPLTWNTQTADDLTFENTVAPYIDGPAPILIVRHPPDALVSSYMHNNNQAGHEQRRKFSDLPAFINDKVYGLEKFCRFYGLWSRARQKAVIRYEDMKADPENAMIDLFAAATLPIDTEVLKEAIDFASFDNMKAIEQGNAPTYKSSGLRVFATGDRSNPNAFHVRRGSVGGICGLRRRPERSTALTHIFRNTCQTGTAIAIVALASAPCDRHHG